MDETDSVERGPKSPGDSLPEALSLLNLLRERVGFAEASRETVAEALGYTTLNGTSKRKIAALVHYDFIARSGSTYRITDLGRRILMPTNDVELADAISEAAKRPALYAKLFTRYEGHVLPAMLPNVLAREFKVLPKSSVEVAANFRDSVEFAGLLRGGVLFGSPSSDRSSGGAQTGVRDEVRPVETSVSAAIRELRDERESTEGRASKMFVVALDNDGRAAEIRMPLPLTTRDIRKLSAWVSYMMSVVDEEKPGEVS